MATTETPEYEAYRAKVIEECVKLMGEQNRDFFTTQCSWEEPFEENRDPAEVANDEYEALT